MKCSNYNTSDNELQENFEILCDVNSSGKPVDWKYHKTNSLELSKSYSRLGYSDKAFRVWSCGSDLIFKKFSDGTLKLHSANFCKVRLCPMCAWRRSKKIFAQVSTVMDSLISDDSHYRFLFLTLTCKNVRADELSDTITHLFKAFKSLVHKKQFSKSVKGYFRALEVTYNKVEDTYHPHFHLVLVVKEYYFERKEYYITQEEWSLLWQKCLGVNYIPVVDVRTFKGKTDDDISKAVAEVAKYSVKPSDYLIRRNVDKFGRVILSKKFGQAVEDITDKVVDTLDKALRSRRLVAFGGVMKDLHKQLNLDDAENGDLVNTGDDELEIRSDLAYILVKYSWDIGYNDYVFSRIIE